MLLDLHMHSEYSEDAKPNASVEAICRASVARGLSIIALTDHKDFYFEQPPLFLDIDAQRRDVARCQREFDGALTLLSGVELGEIHACAEAAEYVVAYDFDEVIGSLHVRRSNDIDIYFQDWEKTDPDDFLEEYFADLLRMVRVGGFDILAHIDYPLRVMKRPDGVAPSFAGWEDRIEPILREIIDRDIALEINAANLFGWQKQVGTPRFILDMYRNLGGAMISVGSDSHCAPDVGRGIEQCLDHAREAGFHEIAVFRKRKAHAVSI